MVPQYFRIFMTTSGFDYGWFCIFAETMANCGTNDC